ncbi:MAG: hypothetical protein ACYC2I_01780 [Elusimicrobiales bacterium]
MAVTEKNKKKESLAAGLMSFVFIPYWLGIMGEAFAYMYMAGFEHFTGKFKSSIPFGFFTLVLLGYLWVRPALLYKRTPPRSSRRKSGAAWRTSTPTPPRCWSWRPCPIC